MKEDRFQEWASEYHHWFGIGNERKTDIIPIHKIKDVPIMMVAGKNDILADLEDAKWTRDEIGDAVIEFLEIDGGHETFIVGKDMTWFS